MSKDTPFVAVGCKLPNGLILDVKNLSGENVRVTLVGANAAKIVGGYGITENVPSDFMTQWLTKNARHPAVVNKSIFIHNDMGGARSIAKENAARVSGLEAIDPISSGMLRGESDDVDRKALADYNAAKAKNPERNRQQVE